MSDDQFMNQLNADERILIQARMLPMGNQLTDKQISDVRGDYFKYRTQHEISDAKVAKAVNVSQSVVSQWCSAKYKGDNQKLTRAINNWMERDAKRRRSELPTGYVKTTVAEEMKAIIGVACRTSSMVAIVAPAGSGKTMVMEILADKYRGVYLYCHQDHKPRQFMLDVAKACGASVSGKSTAEMLRSIVDKLKGTNRPIFLDEAHTLPKAVFARIRAIHDLTGCPIIMAGADQILENIDDRALYRGQMSSRCLQYCVNDHILNASDPDGNGKGGSLFSKPEVKKFLDQLEVKLDSDAFGLAWAVACLPGFGTLRTLRRVVITLRPERDRRSSVIRKPEILNVLSLLFGMQGKTICRDADRHVKIARKVA